MRARMKTVRDTHDGALVRGAYAQWREAFRLRAAEQRHRQIMTAKFYRRWRARLVEKDQLENRGDGIVALREQRLTLRCWELWKRELAVRRAENTVTERVGLRILATTFDTWKRRL